MGQVRLWGGMLMVEGGWTSTFRHFGRQGSLPLQCFWTVIAMQMGVWAGYPSVNLIFRHMTLPAGSCSANLWCGIDDVQGTL